MIFLALAILIYVLPNPGNKLHFTVYKPTSVPASWGAARTDEFFFIGQSWADDTTVYIAYPRNASVVIYEFNIAAYGGSQISHCGPVSGQPVDIQDYKDGKYNQPCSLVGRTPNGFTIYKSAYSTYATKGSTRVNINNLLDTATAEKIIGSLQPVSASYFSQSD